MQRVTAFYANHLLDGLMHNIVFHRKDHNFLMACILFRTYHIRYKQVPNNDFKG